MQAEQRIEVCTRLESSMEALTIAAERLSSQQWGFRVEPSSWSASQCVEHLAEVEKSILHRIQTLVAEGFSDPALCAETMHKEVLLRRAVPKRTRLAVAPRQPAGQPDFAAVTDGLATFRALRQETLAYARTTQDEVEKYAYPHFVFGPLNIYQWLLMLSLHCERHTAQIEEIKASPEFPTA